MRSRKETLAWRKRLFETMPAAICTLVLFSFLGSAFTAKALYAERSAAIIEQVNQHNKTYVKDVLLSCVGKDRLLEDKPVVLVSTQHSDLERAVITTCVDAYLDGGAELTDHQRLNLDLTMGDYLRVTPFWHRSIFIDRVATIDYVVLSESDRDLPDLPAWSITEASAAHRQFIIQSSTLLEDHVRNLVGSSDSYVLIGTGLFLAGIGIAAYWSTSIISVPVGLILVATAGVQLSKPIAEVVCQHGFNREVERYVCAVEFCDDQVSQYEKEFYVRGKEGCFRLEDGVAIDLKTRTVTISKRDEALTRENWECLRPLSKPLVNPNLREYYKQSWTIIKRSDRDTH